MDSMKMPFPSLGFSEPVELLPIGVKLSRVSAASEIVLEINRAGSPAAQAGGEIFATREFAECWGKRTRRFKKVPTSGVRLSRLVADCVRQVA